MREKTKRLYKKKILLELKRQTLKKKIEKKKCFENVMRAINENDFVNLLQFSSQKSVFKNVKAAFTIKNKIFYRNDKSLNYKHITVKNF